MLPKVLRLVIAVRISAEPGTPRWRICAGLTFDMSGGWRHAKHAVDRPLDGVVRPHFNRHKRMGPTSTDVRALG